MNGANCWFFSWLVDLLWRNAIDTEGGDRVLDDDPRPPAPRTRILIRFASFNLAYAFRKNDTEPLSIGRPHAGIRLRTFANSTEPRAFPHSSHLGGPWGQQIGLEVVVHSILFDFAVILGPYLESFLGTEACHLNLFSGLFPRRFFLYWFLCRNFNAWGS